MFTTYWSRYSRMDLVKFVEDRLQILWSDMVCLVDHITTISLQIFQRLYSTNFTWLILEYLDLYLISGFQRLIVMLCGIWSYLYNLKNVRNTHVEVLLLIKLQAETCNFTKINTPPWMFFTFFILCKCYQIAQIVSIQLH